MKKNDDSSNANEKNEHATVEIENRNFQNENNLNATFKICPTCSSKSLKTENGCDMCVECGYSKCDK